MLNHYEQAMLCADNACWEEATELLQKAKAENPKCPVTRRMLSIGLLTTGRIREGLEEFEWRFEMPIYESPRTALDLGIAPKIRHRYKLPYWDGKADLNGKTILVFNEGGHGDILQNVRYLPQLKIRGARVILEAKREVCRLLEKTAGIDELRPCGSTSTMIFFEQVNQTGIDYVVSLHSLMYYLDPDLDNIPWEFPYVFPQESNSEAVRIVRDCSAETKVGIVWAGTHGHSNDYIRSAFKRDFQPLKDIKNVQLFSLQKGKMIRSWVGKKVDLLAGGEVLEDIDLGPLLSDFNDTAAVAKELDALVCVDTSTTHMAGAIDVPVWTALPYKAWAEWRWQKRWYKSQRVFYQETDGDWKTLLTEIAKDIWKS